VLHLSWEFCWPAAEASISFFVVLSTLGLCCPPGCSSDLSGIPPARCYGFRPCGVACGEAWVRRAPGGSQGMVEFAICVPRSGLGLAPTNPRSAFWLPSKCYRLKAHSHGRRSWSLWARGSGPRVQGPGRMGSQGPWDQGLRVGLGPTARGSRGPWAQGL